MTDEFVDDPGFEEELDRRVRNFELNPNQGVSGEEVFQRLRDNTL